VRVILLVPADVLDPRHVDEHWAGEAAAARAAGWDVARIDHDALTRAGGAPQAVSRVRGCGEAVYRGWMLGSDRYAAFERALCHRGVVLRTDARRYRRAHELPGWYPALAGLTPASVWTEGTGREAMFVPDLADGAHAWSVATRLRVLREDAFVGGFVLRRFEPFQPGEVRTWWVDGTCRLTTAHPDTPTTPPPADLDLPPVTTAIAGAIAALGLRWATVDLARRSDGVWRVVELGDAQVSDRPTSTPPETRIATLDASIG
jgi:ATP-grasp domain, R2K clade family 3